MSLFRRNREYVAFAFIPKQGWNKVEVHRDGLGNPYINLGDKILYLRPGGDGDFSSEWRPMDPGPLNDFYNKKETK